MLLFKIKTAAFIYFYVLINISIEEQPISICLSTHPFRLSDSTCGNFNEICIKKENEECKNFMSACKQCPPSNYTVLMLSEILRISKNQQALFTATINKMEKFKEMHNDSLFEIKKDLGWKTMAKINSYLNSIYVLSAVSIALLVLLIIYVIIRTWKSTECKHKKNLDKKHEIFSDTESEHKTRSDKILSDIQCRHEKKLDKIFEILSELQTANTTSENENFIDVVPLFENQQTKTITYLLNDNFYVIKTKIAKRLSCKINEILLFIDNKYMADTELVAEYGLREESVINFCRFEDVNRKFDVITNLLAEGDTPLSVTNVDDVPVARRFDCFDSSNWSSHLMLLNELRAFQFCKSNSSFVQLLGVCKDRDYWYIIKERASRGSLKDFIYRNREIKFDQIKCWTRQIVNSINFLHSHGIIHRNLKPSKILFDSDGNLKINDFTLSFDVTKELLKANLGKSKYNAPELEDIIEYGKPADVYAIGVITYEMITGSNDITDCNPKLSNSKLEDFVKFCLMKNPEERKTIEQLVE